MKGKRSGLCLVERLTTSGETVNGIFPRAEFFLYFPVARGCGVGHFPEEVTGMSKSFFLMIIGNDF